MVKLNIHSLQTCKDLYPNMKHAILYCEKYNTTGREVNLVYGLRLLLLLKKKTKKKHKYTVYYSMMELKESVNIISLDK